MSKAGQEGPLKIGHSGSIQLWNVKGNDLIASLRGDSTGVDSQTSSTVISKSASYSDLPITTDTSSFRPSLEKGGIKRTFSENLLASVGNGVHRRTTPNPSPNAVVEPSKSTNILRRKSSRFRLDLKSSGSLITTAERQANPELAELPKAVLRDRAVNQDVKSRSVSGSLSSLARRSWMGSSRSPSPSKRHDVTAPSTSDKLHVEVGARRVATASEKPSLPRHSVKGEVTVSSANDLPLQRKVTAKKSKRPLSVMLGKSAPAFGEGRPAVPPIPKSFSYDKLALSLHGRPGPDSLQALPRSVSTERMNSWGSEALRKRDELWNTFRGLDGEFQKLSSKPSAAKTNIIRGTLLPFLKAYADHASNTMLRVEDLDRRITILNKWWGGLLEMLSGRNGQSVSGTDRPAILEGIAGIMERPEWRLPLSAVQCRVDKSRPSLRSRSSSSLAISVNSTSSDLLAESVFHNVRNIFVQNLLSQMAFVVDKMAMRSVPASVVAFCGKAAAYAFFFCPGVAEILVRLWGISQDSIRRVLGESDIPKFSNFEEVAEKIASGFPTHLRPLAFRSLPSLMKHLRCRPHLFFESLNIQWQGPWMGRWAGRDSDLFFVFVKHHHILTCDMLPESVTRIERACAPSHVLVRAQLLSVLDATIHRAGNRPHPETNDGPSSITFDDLLGADVPATPLPLPAPNASRLMAENRLIMLLRELLSDASTVSHAARRAFAESFEETLKAASRRTSLFDHNACFALCNFLEEAISILVRYHRDTTDPISFLDWDFWRGVCEQMMDSNNSMTEVRLYAFIYGLWGLVTKNEERKKQITIDWLLTEAHFQRQFNHWCPMVRAYYMRLLCWRVARFDGEATETDLAIYGMLSARLKQTWRHFIYVQEHADKHGLPPPSTTPCSPAPGRRLLIVRNDMNVGPGGTFLSFDNIFGASATTGQSTAYERHSSLDSLKEMADNSDPKEASRSSSPGRKRWGLLRNMNPFNSTTADQTTSNGLLKDNGTGHAEGPPAEPRRGSDNAKLKPDTAATAAMRNSSTLPDPQPQNLSFKFSLEWNDRPANIQRDRKLYPPRLPVPAQTWLQSKKPEPSHLSALRPEGPAAGSSKYSGRALAEWAVLINECQNFFERRKYEGILGLKRVETPTLGVEAFRRPG